MKPGFVAAFAALLAMVPGCLSLGEVARGPSPVGPPPGEESVASPPVHTPGSGVSARSVPSPEEPPPTVPISAEVSLDLPGPADLLSPISGRLTVLAHPGWTERKVPDFTRVPHADAAAVEQVLQSALRHAVEAAGRTGKETTLTYSDERVYRSCGTVYFDDPGGGGQRKVEYDIMGRCLIVESLERQDASTFMALRKRFWLPAGARLEGLDREIEFDPDAPPDLPDVVHVAWADGSREAVPVPAIAPDQEIRSR